MKKLFVFIVMLHACSLTANFRIPKLVISQALSNPTLKVGVLMGYSSAIVVGGGLYATHRERQDRAQVTPRPQPKPQPEVGTPAPSER